ncbi:MAG: hypothetical protein ABI986_10100 [Chloroflexota bacterium]
MVKKQQTTPATKSRFNSVAGYAIIALWIVIGLYFGIAGWIRFDFDALVKNAAAAPDNPVIYKGITFRSPEDLATIQQNEKIRGSVFGWVLRMRSPLLVLISAPAFGIVGNSLILLRKRLKESKVPGIKVPILSPPVGGLTALMVMGVIYVLPSAIPIDKNVLVNPISQLCISLLVGAYTDQIHNWLQYRAEKVFQTSITKGE